MSTLDRAKEWFRKFKLEEFPEPEYIPIRYPVLLCHGYGAIASIMKQQSPFYDIAMMLRRHGISAFAPNIVPYATIETRAESWHRIIQQVIADTRSEKLNIVAHSMGGLDIRHAIEAYDLEPAIASLTTIATPHRGTSLADYYLERPKMIRHHLSAFTDWVADYIYPATKNNSEAAVRQLTTDYITEVFSREHAAQPDIPCFSYSAAVDITNNDAVNSLLKIQHRIIEKREGPNDGFISVASASWAEHIETIELSHLEQINLNVADSREDLFEAFWMGVVRRLAEGGF